MSTHFLGRLSSSLMGLRTGRADTLAWATRHRLPHRRPYHVYVALGSNLGDRALNLQRAVEALNEPTLGHVQATSGLFESKAQYVTEQPDFLNAVCRIQTLLPPLALLSRLQEIEKMLGRVKGTQRFGPRTLDLDILYYHEDDDPSKPITFEKHGEKKGSEEGSLFVPHVRLHEREFVLRPLAELAPSLRHPSQEQITVKEMLRALVMGILNATPDSFSDGGIDAESVEAAVERAVRMREEGAGIIDIGGESTRPGADEVGEEEELRRVVPIIQGIRAHDKDTLLSIDTRRAGVARAAVEAGVDIVNDVSGGGFDSKMLATVAALDVPYIIMHMRGTPQTMMQRQHSTYNEDAVEEVCGELWGAVGRAEEEGVRRWSMLVDPGIGFAKGLEVNMALLRGLDCVCERMVGLPVLVGVSRKKFLGTLCDEPRAEERDVMTSVVNAVAISRGAAMVRVHNVPMAVQTVRLADSLRK
ncbi:dihydropteroate synthase [Nannochloropsis oceanica]